MLLKNTHYTRSGNNFAPLFLFILVQFKVLHCKCSFPGVLLTLISLLFITLVFPVECALQLYYISSGDAGVLISGLDCGYRDY